MLTLSTLNPKPYTLPNPSLLLYDDSTAGGGDDGRINAMEGDTLTVSYNEPYRATSGAARVRTPKPGTLNLVP